MTSPTMVSPNVAVWFEIPATDFARAVRFYETVFQVRLVEERCPTSDLVMGVFPAADDAVKGCVCSGEGYTPGGAGPIVYLNAGADLAGPLARVEAAGGRVLVGKTLISETIGYYAHIADTEGNRIGLHSLR